MAVLLGEYSNAVCGWMRPPTLQLAKVMLTGPARTWVQRQQFHSWQHFKDQLIARFGKSRQAALAMLERCYQELGESPQAFADRFLHTAGQAGRVEDEALVYEFTSRLQPDLRFEVVRQQLYTIEQIVAFCSYWLGCWSHPEDYCSDADDDMETDQEHHNHNDYSDIEDHVSNWPADYDWCPDTMEPHVTACSWQPGTHCCSSPADWDNTTTAAQPPVPAAAFNQLLPTIQQLREKDPEIRA